MTNCNKENMSTHASFRFMMKIAQCLGMLPVCGISSENSRSLTFCWTSKRTLFSLSFLFLTFMYTFFKVLMLFRLTRVPFYEYVGLFWLLASGLTIGFFIKIATEWSSLMEKWTEVDVKMANYGSLWSSHIKQKIIASIILTAAIIEQAVSFIYACKLSKRRETVLETLRHFLRARHPHVFEFIPYNPILGVILQVFIYLSNMTQNFRDIFIMVISLSLSAKLKQVATYVRLLTRSKECRESVWGQVREDYTRLMHLRKLVEDVISTIMMISFINNLFMVTVQLYYYITDSSKNTVEEKIYHFYSFAFLVIRTYAVALYAAAVDSESRRFQFYLNVLSHKVFNREIERFLFQVKYETPALTCHNFFKITKPIVLPMCGAVVSYELILVQFIKR